MLTLAQRLVNGGSDIDIENPDFHAKVVALLAPRPGSTVLEARTCAERLSFSHDPYRLIKRQLDAKILDVPTILDTTRQIANPMWIEWEMADVPGVRIGFLVHYFDAKTYIVCMIGGDIVGMAFAVNFAMPLPFGRNYNTANMQIGIYSRLWRTQDRSPIIGECLLECFCGIFTLCTPRVADITPLVISRPVRRRQLRDHPNQPLIEFKTVNMRIGETLHHSAVHSYDPDGSHDPIHRRLHRVIGHYRTYVKDRSQPHVSFIPEHWRGDPALGIVLHNRIINEKGTKS